MNQSYSDILFVREKAGTPITTRAQISYDEFLKIKKEEAFSDSSSIIKNENQWEFNNVILDFDLELDQSDLAGIHKLSFFNCQLKSLSVHGLEVEMDLINCDLHNLAIQNCTDTKLIAQNLQIDYMLTIEESSMKGLSISSSDIYWFSQSTSSINFIFMESVNIESFGISDTSVASLEIVLAKIQYVKLSRIVSENFVLRSIQSDMKYSYINTGTYYDFITEFWLDSIGIQQGEISGWRCNEFWMQGIFDEDSKLNISSCSINGLRLNNFFNYGRVNFSNLDNPDSFSYLSFVDADLGKTQFINFPFSKLNLYEIISADVSGITLIGEYIPTNIGRSGNERSNIALFYNQLHISQQRQGNRTKEIEYYTEYMDCKKSEVRKTDRATYFVLWLNKVTSNHGTSWVRALLVYLIASIILFFTYSILVETTSLGIHHLSIENLSFFTSRYFQFIQPLHSEDILTKNTNPAPLILDYLSRILLGFLLYQFIAAFRRFGKIT